MSTFVTGDLHLFHERIIQYCRRPFMDSREMNAALVFNWKQAIAETDMVYVLGDFAFTKGHEQEIVELFAGLPGRKVLLKGNHDKGMILELGWEEIHREPVSVDGVWLAHDGEEFRDMNPIPGPQPWGHERMPIFAAHVHEVWKQRANVLNCGVDVWHFRPVSFGDAMDYWRKRWEYYTAHGQDA